MTNFRDIVVDACPRGDLERTLDFARIMAKIFDARLSVASFGWPKMTITDVLAPSFFWAEDQTRLLERALASSRAIVDKVFAEDREHIRCFSEIADPNVAMREFLLTTDLLITDSTVSEDRELPNPAQLAHGSGVPVLRLGRSLAGAPFSNVMVAWKDTAQARRAVHEALPLLIRAESVSVVGAGDEISSVRLEAIAAHLRAHRVKAGHLHIPDDAGNTCSILLEQARRAQAELIVTGVMKTGSLTNRFFGSVTAEMLKNAEICWFMAH